VADGATEASGARSRRVAGAVAVAAAAVLIVVALATRGGGEEQADGLRIERAPNGAEVVVYIENREANVPATAGGATSVMVECLDRKGKLLLRAQQVWPFTGTDGGSLAPHVHMPLDPELLPRVDRCRVKGADPVLEGGLL
jgi:hypothetical protein